ncbi:S53 family peptidase [Ktedonospora formicarum]|uniref:Peptidase S53 domain-containing protein n=1 Tax=Ktedonospora formicarum TaxID=2778364 RepID=A0A8J3HV54_9CHLR|nr:S53 family peptidase [Ktedonospora formicarum]GHO44339.1 hypothetical protein KSX_25020 [Ktedonospora formicarum]
MPFKALLSGTQRKPGSMRYWLIGSAVALALLAGLGATILPNMIGSASANQLSSIPGSVPSVVKNSKNVSTLTTNQTLSMAVSLKLRNKEALESLLRDTKDKKSVNYGRHLTADQVKNSFTPTQESYDAVIAYLQSQGFTVTQTYSNRLLISFSGTAAQAETAFHVQINNYVDPSGTQFYSNANDPTLPPTMAGLVQGIVGLDNYAKFTHSPVKKTEVKANTSSNAAEPNAVTCYAASSDANYYTPSQLATAYNYDGLYNKGFRGEGQSIALFELATFNLNDIKAFTNCYGKSQTSIQTIPVTGNIRSDGGMFEVALDADIVLSMAPKLNQLRIYEASNDVPGYLSEWARIISDNTPVVSVSWGLCEANRSQNTLEASNNLFMIAAAQGQTIVASSGDDGSSGCQRSSTNQNALSVSDPASQPYVTGVGGTSLTVDANNKYTIESVWNETAYSDSTSGGGVSTYWAHPAWQTGTGTDSSLMRQVPDVSLHAGGDKYYLVYCTISSLGCSAENNWWLGAGTSAAAPMWAAFVALANEQSVKSGGYNLGFINPYLYQITDSKYTSDFHDVTIGNNDYQGLQGGKYPATTGYDMATGLGSFNATNLANDLVTMANATKGARQAPASKIWYFAEGSVGGSDGFQEFISLQNPDATTDAQVKVTYLFATKTALSKTYTVKASTRYTVNVNAEVGLSDLKTVQYALSAIVEVTSGPGIVAERPMYFNYRGLIKGGTDAMGASQPGTSYYFPLADTTQNKTTQAWTYISILNPSKTQTANVTITYEDGHCGNAGQTACRTQIIPVGALKRGTGTPTAVGFKTKTAVSVTSDLPVVVERPLYIRTNVATSGGWTTGSSSEVGATAPATTAYFAQGNTGKNFQQYFVIANYGDVPANVSLNLVYKSDSTTSPKTITATVAPHTQYTVDVNKSNAGLPSDFGAEVSSDQPVVVDREELFHYGSALQSGQTDVIGTPTPKSVYSFSEGFISSTFTQYVSILNPTDNDETVVITYFGSGSVFQQQFVVKAHKIILVNVSNAIAPFGDGNNSSTVQAMSGTIVVERLMYFGYHDRTGGSDVIGYTGD